MEKSATRRANLSELQKRFMNNASPRIKRYYAASATTQRSKTLGSVPIAVKLELARAKREVFGKDNLYLNSG